MEEILARKALSAVAPFIPARLSETDFPIAAALARPDTCLAMITHVEGASYRPLGAAMVVNADGTTVGSLSSGCIDRDVALHACAAIESDRPQQLRYGRGSPFFDLELPCGGGLEITLIPHPSRMVLEQAALHLANRQTTVIAVGGDHRLTEAWEDHDLLIQLVPRLRFLVFGKGPEPQTFAALAKAAGQDVRLYAPDAETRAHVEYGRPLNRGAWPEGLEIDNRTAIALFFHDHDWEPPLLKHALASPALYVGAQGSARARERRADALTAAGVTPAEIARMATPFGLVRHARDPYSLAAGVLAQVMDHARIA